MFLSLMLIASLGILGNILGDLPYPAWSEVEKNLPRVCFSPSSQTLSLAENQNISCVWAHPGEYPPQEVAYDALANRCCFWDARQDPGIFWAIGDAVMSRVLEVGTSGESATYAQTQSFTLYPAALTKIQVVDALTDAPVPRARVTMADQAVHMVSFDRQTDANGYVVLPMIPGGHSVVTVRANRYLAPPPLRWMAQKPADLPETAEERIETPSQVISLDPGIEIFGVVTSPDGQKLEGARLHIEIERSDIAGAMWHSDLDLPRAVEKFATSLGGWVPVRSSYSSSPEGKFRIQTLPRGKMSIYASHPDFVPSARAFLDTSDAAQISAIQLALNAPKRAYVRVEDAHHVAIPAQIVVVDDQTGHAMGEWQTSPSGALEIKYLPTRARFQIVSETHAFLQETREIQGNDELIFTLSPLSQENPTLRVTDADQTPIYRATISIADPELQKKYPLCLGKTDRQGMAQLESCPPNFQLSVFHPDFAHLMTGFDTRQAGFHVKMDKGHDVQIEMLEDQTQHPVLGVQCALKTYYDEVKNHIHTETLAPTDHILTLHHRPSLPHVLTCTSPAQVSRTVRFVPPEVPQNMIFPYTMSREVLVMDAYSSPVGQARLKVGGRSYETDASGRVMLSATPQDKIQVLHWLHGQTEVTWEAGNSLLEIRLPDIASPAIVECLQKHHIDPVIDSAAILVNHDVPEKGLKRADAIEECSPQRLTLVRQGRRMDVKMR